MYISGTDSSYYYQTTQNTQKPQKPSAEDFFSIADTSDDGKVDQSELESLVSGLEAKTGDSINVDEQFAEFDADGDGSYSSEELQSFMEANRPDPADIADAGQLDDSGAMMRPDGPPPPPPPSSSSESEDDETDTIEELLSSLEDSEDSGTNSYLSILQSLQDELFSLGASTDDDDDDSTSSIAEYLNKLNSSIMKDADYTSFSIEA